MSVGIVRELQISFREREVLDPRVGEPIQSVEAVARLMSFLRFAADEEVYALILDVERKLICIRQVSRGGRHETSLDAASLFRAALLAEGTALIVVHNHPSGGVRPSQADIDATTKVVMAGIALHLPLLDHVVIGGKAEYSFAQSGMLRFLEAKALRVLGFHVPDVKHPEEREREVRAAFANLGKKPDAESPMIEPPLAEYVELAHTEGR
jgi:proteasome lid subunit RPN8/RPN11